MTQSIPGALTSGLAHPTSFQTQTAPLLGISQAPQTQPVHPYSSSDPPWGDLNKNCFRGYRSIPENSDKCPGRWWTQSRLLRRGHSPAPPNSLERRGAGGILMGGREAGGLRRTEPRTCPLEVRPCLRRDTGPQWDVSPGLRLGAAPGGVAMWTGSWLCPPIPLGPALPALTPLSPPWDSGLTPSLSPSPAHPPGGAFLLGAPSVQNSLPPIRGTHAFTLSGSLLKGSLPQEPLQQPARPTEPRSPSALVS